MRLLKSVFVAILVASGLRAQTVQQLTRITSTTGVTDSMLVAVCDSVRPVCRTRAVSLDQIRKGLSPKAFDSMLVTGVLKASAALNYFSGTEAGSAIATSGIYASRLAGLAAAAGPSLVMIRVNGSLGTPTALASGNPLGQVAWQGYDGTVIGQGPRITGSATEAWTATAHGSKLFFTTTANTITSAANTLILDQDTSATFGGRVISTGLATFNNGATIATGPLTLGTAAGAATVTGTAATGSDQSSSAITFNANTGTGTGTVGGFVFAVPVTTSTGTTAQTLTKGLVVTATTVPLVYANGADSASTILPTTSPSFATQTQINVVRAAAASVVNTLRVNGTLAAPTIITSGNSLGLYQFRGAMTATTSLTSASIGATATENWVASTSGGTKLTFSVTPNSTAALAIALTLDQDKSATFTGTVNGVASTWTGVGTAQNWVANAGLQANGASRATLAWSAPSAILYSHGADASTNGQIQLSSLRSDGSNNVTMATFAPTSLTLGSLAVSGITTLAATGPTTLGNGSQSAPAYSWTSETNSGWYRSATNDFYFAIAGSPFLEASIVGGVRYLTMQNNTRVELGDGTVANPSLHFANSSGLGAYRFGADTLGLATGGVHSLDLSGGASVKLRGGAGNFTLQCGTGNSRTCTFQSTTSSGTAKNTLVLGADSSVTSLGQFRAPDFNGSGGFVFSGATTTGMARDGNGFLVLEQGGNAIVTLRGSTRLEVSSAIGAPSGTAALPGYTFGIGVDTTMGLYQIGTAGANDTLGIAVNGVSQMKIGAAGVLRLPNLPAEGATKNAQCWDPVTFNATQNAGATCTISARRFKQNIGEVSAAFAWNLLKAVPVDSFTYRAGGRRAFGTIADDLAPIDERLITRDAKGLVNAANYEQLGILTLLVQRDDHRRIDSLITALRKKP